MNSILRIVFDELILQQNEKFVTDEMDTQQREFLRINFSDKDTGEFEDIYNDFYDMLWEVQEKAFEMGFNTAVDLLTRTNADERKIKNEFVKQKNR